ncbi:hypothetical protein DWY69_12520 [Eisenbergiella massiliensis]|uniref:Uncharacterized protein n=1 Tax=Eisenbergiella massiliensis TaxID=1720294 RepID=A0A3E3IWG8_9FIRM|nr:hypothetical protein DXC51_13430 [Eisenbergiella massiliensis]RGE71428.1 hypothetical protein DWY69_12520 [Eisenbergiella massiliensis]
MLFLLFISQDTKKHGPYSRRNADYACVFLFLTGCRLKNRYVYICLGQRHCGRRPWGNSFL